MKEETVLTCVFKKTDYTQLEWLGWHRTKVKCEFVTPNNKYVAYISDNKGNLNETMLKNACLLYVFKKKGVKLLFDDESYEAWIRKTYDRKNVSSLNSMYKRFIGKDQHECDFWQKFTRIDHSKFDFNDEIVKEYLNKEICK